MKRFAMVFLVVLLVGQLSTGASAEEKAVEYEGNANNLLQKGDQCKDELEYGNSLQIIRNLPDAWYGLDRVDEIKQQWRQAYATLNRIREIKPGKVNVRTTLVQLLLASSQLDYSLSRIY